MKKMSVRRIAGTLLAMACFWGPQAALARWVAETGCQLNATVDAYGAVPNEAPKLMPGTGYLYGGYSAALSSAAGNTVALGNYGSGSLEINATAAVAGSYIYTVFDSDGAAPFVGTQLALRRVYVDFNLLPASTDLRLLVRNAADQLWYVSQSVACTDPIWFDVPVLNFQALATSDSANLNALTGNDEFPITPSGPSGTLASFGVTLIDGGGVYLNSSPLSRISIAEIHWYDSSAHATLYSAGAATTIDFNDMKRMNGFQLGIRWNSYIRPNPGYMIDRLSSTSFSADLNGAAPDDLLFEGIQTGAGYNGGATSSSVTTAGFYAFDLTGGTDNNYALGMQPDGSNLTPGHVTLRVHNNTGSTLQNLVVSYDVYYRNDQDNSNSITFSHSPDNSTYTAVGALDFASPTTLDAAGYTHEGGATFPSRQTTLTGLSIAPGAFYYLRFATDRVSGSGADDELALDNISITGFVPVSLSRFSVE